MPTRPPLSPRISLGVPPNQWTVEEVAAQPGRRASPVVAGARGRSGRGRIRLHVDRNKLRIMGNGGREGTNRQHISARAAVLEAR